MIWITAGLLIVAAAVRVWLTIRDPAPWRVALTAAMVFLALGVLIQCDLAGFDRFTWPNASRLIIHIFLTFSAAGVFCYVAYFRDDQPSRRTIGGYIGGSVLVCIGLVLGWLAAPLPHHTATDLTPVATSTGFVLHQALFYGWLIACLATTSSFCLRHARAEDEDLTRSVAARLIGWGCGLSVVCFAIFLFAGIAQYLTGRYPSKLNLATSAALPLPLAMLAAGLFVMIVVPRLEPTVRAWRRLRLLTPLHRRLTTLYPEVQLPPGGRRSMVVREQRAVIEIHDALTRVRVPGDTAAGHDALAAAIATAADGGKGGRSGSTAASDMLAGTAAGADPPFDDTRALLDLARAFKQHTETDGRADAPHSTSTPR